MLNQWAVIDDTRRRIEQVAERTRPDILHAHSPCLNGIAALQAGRKLGIPVVYEMRASWEDAAVDHGTTQEGSLRYRLSRALETWTLRRAEAVTTICEGLRKDILARGIPAERVTVIPNAVNPEAFPLIGAPDPELEARLGLGDAFTLGFIGSFYGYEGLDTLLEAMPAILEFEPGARVLLVGGGLEEERLKAQAAALGIADRVVFTGRVPHAEVTRYYSLVDLLVFPRKSIRLTETVTPLKPLEAMAQGRLLIASDVGGHRELIRDGVTGRLFRPDDPAALAAAVRGCWPSASAGTRCVRPGAHGWSRSATGLRASRAMRTSMRRRRPRRAGHDDAAARVLLVGPLPPPSGGMANQTRQLKRLLEGEGIVVSLVQTNAPYRPAWVGGIPVLRAAFRLAPYLRRLWRAVVEADVVHVMANSGWAWHLLAAPAIRIAKARGRPVVVNYRGGLASEFLERSARSVIATLAGTRLVVPSGFLQSVFLRHGVEAEIIPNVVDLERFRPADPPRPATDAPHVVVARNLEPIYGIDLALRALALAARRHPRLSASIAGSGPERGRLEALCNELGITDRVRFTGRLDVPEMAALYGEADLVLNPARADNTPNSILEALACGVPVVSTSVGGVPVSSCSTAGPPGSRNRSRPNRWPPASRRCWAIQPCARNSSRTGSRWRAPAPGPRSATAGSPHTGGR